MNRLEQIWENRTIGEFARRFTRSPEQVNKLHETDAELIVFDGDKSRYLAVTIDTVADEIAEGLYRDPFTMGWVTVMANLSDLSAVGAEPLGLVTAISIESNRKKLFRDRIADGMEEACRCAGTFLLGGDFNFTHFTSLTGCAIGTVPRNNKLGRVGCRAGDIVFLSDRAGSGNALGLVRKKDLPENLYPESSYRPEARTREALVVREYASCCMDTSDGLFITIDQLIRLNGRGFLIEAFWEDILEKKVCALCQRIDVPFWFMAAGIHGEFELLFTVPHSKVDSFLDEAKQIDFFPIRLGKVTDSPRFLVAPGSGKTAEIDMAPLRDLWNITHADIDHIIEKYYSAGKEWGLN